VPFVSSGVSLCTGRSFSHAVSGGTLESKTLYPPLLSAAQSPTVKEVQRPTWLKPAVVRIVNDVVEESEENGASSPSANKRKKKKKKKGKMLLFSNSSRRG